VSRPHPRRSADRLAIWIGLLFCAIALSASPLLQHDPECHAKPLRHCDACMANPLALSACGDAALQPFRLLDAGRVDIPRPAVPEPAFAVETPGRSPPA
jgi:hypothetical protein